MFSVTTVKKVLFGSAGAFQEMARQVPLSRYKESQSHSNGATRLCTDPSRIWIVDSAAQWDVVWPLLQKELHEMKVLSMDCEWYNWKTERPVSLLQLSSCSGLVLLVRLMLLDYFPSTLTQVLEDRRIIKVGIAIEDDVKKLSADHGITVQGWMDLRNLALQENVIATIRGHGLAGLSKTLLGIELKKNKTLSNWETETLSEKQVEYAASDALVGMLIFMHMLSLRLGDRDIPDAQRIVQLMCDGLIEVKLRHV